MLDVQITRRNGQEKRETNKETKQQEDIVSIIFNSITKSLSAIIQELWKNVLEKSTELIEKKSFFNEIKK